jgi:uncharacterized protein (TIGR02145 family)
MSKIILLATIASLVLIIFLAACRKDEEENVAKIKKEKISGFVQKGPFISGTQILMSELNSSLEQTGNVFSTQISNSRGSFEISDVQLSSSFVEFTANGFYFDEIKNGISSAQLTLYAISDISDLNTINVNILTHLEKRRVEYLVKENDYSFEDAKQTAQAEVLAVFGISNEEMQSSETLDISVDHADNAILLAISLILQGNRSVGDLTELLALISSDLRENGVIENEEILNNLRLSALNLNLVSIRQNLAARYQFLNILAAIPEFESYISVFLSFTSQLPAAITSMATDVTAFSATLNGLVNPNSSNTTVSFEYGTTPEFGHMVFIGQNPLIGTNLQPVHVEISGLQNNTNYFFRIVAENEKGTTTSGDRSFKTQSGEPNITTNAISNILAFSAVTGGNITSDGGTPVITRGLVWGTNPDPTLDDNYIEEGTGLGLYSSEITGLIHGTIYYVRSYSINQYGITYGNQRSFNTQDGVASITTNMASIILTFSAISGGNIIADGGTPVTVRGVVWSTNPNPTLDNSHTVDGAGVGSYTSAISGLNNTTSYFVRAYATNAIGTTYGNQISLTTKDGVVTLTTAVISNVTANSAIAGGNITNDEGAQVISRGVVWSINPQPTLADNFSTDGSGMGSFISEFTGLTEASHYYVRAYATNVIDTYYGDEHRFFTFNCGTLLTDVDNNTYNTVLIGNQCWMAENLKTTRFRTNVPIEYPGNNENAWTNNTTGAYSWYNNNPVFKDSYGAMYNWYAATSENGLCPTGWHVPSNTEWLQFITHVAGYGYSNQNTPNGAGNAIKSCRKENSPLGGDCNTSVHPRWDAHDEHHGFDALGLGMIPGGRRWSSSGFDFIGNTAYYWSTNELSVDLSISWMLRHQNGHIYSNNFYKGNGFSVRCIRD